MPDERDAGSLQHMLNAIARIGDYTAGLDLLTFSQVPVVQDAVIRQLMVLGEAANRVSRAMQAQSADVPWRDIIALRNVIVHQYEKINLERIWVTVHDDLPPR
ncbi:MAG TPA: HepT-like ribonuclease domain-containing protein [Longimicrobium sp.]|nr:HepT-like ribonuclease domain-containing protein [Longimicrobium sp.]